MGKKLRELAAVIHEEASKSDEKTKKKSKHQMESTTNGESNHKKRKLHEEDKSKLTNEVSIVGDEDELKKLDVVVSGKGAEEEKYAEMKTINDAKLSDEVLECCKTFTEPSPIQSRAWPFLLDGRDFIGIAATGSGKTLAFGIPGIMHVLGKRK